MCWGDYWVSSSPNRTFWSKGIGIGTRAWHFTFMMTHFCVTLLDLSTTSEPNLWQIEIWKCFCKIYFLFHSILFLIIPENVPCEDLCHFTFCSSFTEPDMRNKDDEQYVSQNLHSLFPSLGLNITHYLMLLTKVPLLLPVSTSMNLNSSKYWKKSLI